MLKPCDIIGARNAIGKIFETFVRCGIEKINAPSQIMDCLKEIDLNGINHKCNKKTLIDFNYSVKIIMSTDTSAIIKMPIVQLELFIKDNNEIIEKIILEMNKEELKNFIEQLVHIEKVFFLNLLTSKKGDRNILCW